MGFSGPQGLGGRFEDEETASDMLRNLQIDNAVSISRPLRLSSTASLSISNSLTPSSAFHLHRISLPVS